MASYIKHLFKKTQENYKKIKGHVQTLKKEHDAIEHPHKVHQEKSEKQKMEITASAGTMAKFVSITIILLLITGFLFEIRNILVLFFVALLFSAALDPLVDALERRKIPRSIGVLLVYLLTLATLIVLISNVLPIVANEVASLAVKIQTFVVNIVEGKIEVPNWLAWLKPAIRNLFDGIDISKVGTYKDILLNVANKLSDVAGNVLNGVFGLFNGLVNTIIVLVITFLMIVDENGIDRFILSLFPARHAEYIQGKSAAIKEKMGHWLRGQVTLCVAVGTLVYIGLVMIGLLTGHPVEYAATIALVAGFTEVIPYIGPFIAWFVAMPMVANQSFGLIIWLTILMYLVQLLENNVIVPVVMKKAVGISPIFIMFSMFVGFEFLGVLGMVLAVPVATALAIFVKDYADREK